MTQVFEWQNTHFLHYVIKQSYHGSKNEQEDRACSICYFDIIRKHQPKQLIQKQKSLKNPQILLYQTDLYANTVISPILYNTRTTNNRQKQNDFENFEKLKTSNPK